MKYRLYTGVALFISGQLFLFIPPFYWFSVLRAVGPVFGVSLSGYRDDISLDMVSIQYLWEASRLISNAPDGICSPPAEGIRS